jgi:hypothetical protein
MINIGLHHFVTFAALAITVSSLINPRPAVAQPPATKGRPPTTVEIVAPLPVPVTGSAVVSGAVKNVDEPGRNPYMITLSCAEATTNVCNVETPPVPAGKRLVLKHVNVAIQLRSPGALSTYFLFLSGSGQNVTLPARLVSSTAPVVSFIFNEPVLTYVEPGQSVIAQALSTALGVTATTTLSGYLVDLIK